MNPDQAADTWILQLRAVRRMQLTFNFELSKEIHMLEFMLKTMGRHQAGVSKPMMS
jgi:hypothetical protein